MTAPKLIASSELLMADARVTVPVVLSVTPPLNAKVSPDALPRFKVPSLLKLAAPLKLFVPPVKAMLATVLSALSAAAATLALKVAVPPTSAKVKLPNPLIAPDAVMSAFAILFSVESVKVFEPPVTAPMVRSPVSYTHLTLPTNREV